MHHATVKERVKSWLNFFRFLGQIPWWEAGIWYIIIQFPCLIFCSWMKSNHLFWSWNLLLISAEHVNIDWGQILSNKGWAYCCMRDVFLGCACDWMYSIIYTVYQWLSLCTKISVQKSWIHLCNMYVYEPNMHGKITIGNKLELGLIICMGPEYLTNHFNKKVRFFECQSLLNLRQILFNLLVHFIPFSIISLTKQWHSCWLADQGGRCGGSLLIPKESFNQLCKGPWRILE